MQTAIAATNPATAKKMIAEGKLDGIQFRASLVDGHLVLEGLLADQAALDEIPCGIYVMETDGTLVACNAMAIAAWGRTPELRSSEKYCGAHILRYPSGEVMPHEHAPPAVVIRNGGTVVDADVICEQPSGNRLLALVNIFPIRDAHGTVIGAVNCFRHNTSKTVPGLQPN
jgi:PAS domain-containing protein